MSGRLVNCGSIEDIRCSLKHGYNPAQLNDELEYERNNKNRSTVIKMIESKIKQTKKDEKTATTTLPPTRPD